MASTHTETDTRHTRVSRLTDATTQTYTLHAVRRVHIVAPRVAGLRLTTLHRSGWLQRHSCVTLSPWQRTPPLASPSLRPLPPQISLLCSSGAGVASGAQTKCNGASTARAWLESCAHREESSLVLRAGPAQLDIEAAARASRAVGLELGDGAEPGARPGGKADGCGHGKVHVVRASVSLARPDGSPVGPSPHRAAGPLRETRQVIVGAAAHLAAGRGARSASTYEV